MSAGMSEIDLNLADSFKNPLQLLMDFHDEGKKESDN